MPTSLIFGALDLSLVGRRLEGAENKPVFRQIYRWTNPHTMLVQCQCRTETPWTLVVREDYTSREILQNILDRIPQPCAIGFISAENFESYYLFGRALKNRVVPLVDARNPDQILEPPSDLNYIVIEDCNAQSRKWAAQRNFTPFFEVTRDGTCLMAAFERARPSN